MDIKLDLPAGVFDADFTEAAFSRRVGELAVLELLRARRLHEHEAQAMLGIGRWELVERMKAAGIAPTEETFEELRGELEKAIKAKNRAKGRR
jgi:phage head maturation protease